MSAVAEFGLARRDGFCSSHLLTGKRPDLTMAQLEDLVRSAIDASDRVAFMVVSLAMAPGRLGWTHGLLESHAMAHAVDAWVGRCARTGGRPWMRSFGDPRAERPCPGCDACRASVNTNIGAGS